MTITDQVQLPRLYLAWLTPAAYQPADAALEERLDDELRNLD